MEGSPMFRLSTKLKRLKHVLEAKKELHQIPRVSSPSTIRDYRSISCCNFTYKRITKVLANRLQPLLPKLNSKTKSICIAEMMALQGAQSRLIK